MIPMRSDIRFEAVSKAGLERWSRPRSFDFLERLPTAPVGDSEILHLSHYCPILVVPSPDGPRVALLLDRTLSRSDPIGRDGRWRPPYCPMALRCLPFWPGKSDRDIEIAIDLVLDHPEASIPLHEESGEPSVAFAAVVTLIERLQQGMRRLASAAKLLAAADLLVPLVIDEPGAAAIDTGYLTVSPPRIAGLKPHQAAALSLDRCLPIDLAMACLFSQRLLAARVRPLREATAGTGRPADAGQSEPQPRHDFEAHMAVDHSPLFSFELFERLEAKAHAAA
jgi:hypothetical protein